MNYSLSLKSCDTELIGLGIIMASRSITCLFNKTLSKYGVSMTQAYALYAISEYRGYNAAYIANKLCMIKDTFIKCVNSLVLKKYIKIYKDSLDSITGYPALTKKGADFLKKVMPNIIELEKKIGSTVQHRESFIQFIPVFSIEILSDALRVRKEKCNEK